MAEYRVQKVRDAFLVLNAEGERVGPFWANELAAERERLRMQVAFDTRLKRGLRPCLSCNAEFQSSSPCRKETFKIRTWTTLLVFKFCGWSLSFSFILLLYNHLLLLLALPVFIRQEGASISLGERK